MITIENNEYMCDGKKVTLRYDGKTRFDHPFGNALDGEPLMGLVAEIMDKLFPHDIKGLTLLEKNSDQKYDVGGKFYSLGVEIKIESVGNLFDDDTSEASGTVFAMKPEHYGFLPAYTHNKIFKEYKGEVKEEMLLFADTRGFKYELPLLVLPVKKYSDFRGESSLKSWKVRWFKVCNEYYLAMASEGQQNWQRLVMDAVFKLKYLLMSFAVEVLGLSLFVSEESSGKKGSKVTVKSEPLC